MMKRDHARDTAAVGMNLTSMIDVTFLLLVFFLLTSRFALNEGAFKAHLPRDVGPSGDPVETVEEIVIQILAPAEQGELRYRLGEVFYPSLPSLENRLRAFDIGQPVTIDADPEVGYGTVIGVLDSCSRVGFSEIAFAAPPRG